MTVGDAGVGDALVVQYPIVVIVSDDDTSLGQKARWSLSSAPMSPASAAVVTSIPRRRSPAATA
jgi:hypothetical protein